MKSYHRLKFVLTLLLTVTALTAADIYADSKSASTAGKTATPKERQAIIDGNSFFRAGKFTQALNKYRDALAFNSESSVAQFNMALANIQVAAQVKNDSVAASQMLENAAKYLEKVAGKEITTNNLSSKAFYNLGNMAFLNEDFGQAIDLYKNALRLNPSDDAARRNLRIAQKKLQKNNRQNQQNKQDQDQKDQKDQQNQQPQQNRQNQPPKPQQIDKQTSDQILNAVERKEARTRQKRNAQPEKATGLSGHSNKNW